MASRSDDGARRRRKQRRRVSRHNVTVKPAPDVGEGTPAGRYVAVGRGGATTLLPPGFDPSDPSAVLAPEQALNEAARSFAGRAYAFGSELDEKLARILAAIAQLAPSHKQQQLEELNRWATRIFEDFVHSLDERYVGRPLPLAQGQPQSRMSYMPVEGTHGFQWRSCPDPFPPRHIAVEFLRQRAEWMLVARYSSDEVLAHVASVARTLVLGLREPSKVALAASPTELSIARAGEKGDDTFAERLAPRLVRRAMRAAGMPEGQARALFNYRSERERRRRS
jgi:hypothetical protein